MASPKFHNTLRQYHRWLGFFLAGIMAVYAVSGILLIFRSTDFMKFEYTTEHLLASELGPQGLEKALHLNITFGVVLLFFVVSAFLMFMPKAKVFKNSIKIAGLGFLFALLVVVFGS